MSRRPRPVLTADHDGVLVADVVAVWAQRHGRPYALTLTGPAGGSWSRGTDVPFCRSGPGCDDRRAATAR